MTDGDDLFPGFDEQFVATPEGTFYTRSGGDGPPLLLLHGYPQTHHEWHAVAPRLAERFRVVVMDLRGYGKSCVPESRDGAGYAKRLMGQDAVAVMEVLGHRRFRLVGHDRGGRVSYRLALDAPERLEKLAVIDIVPTALHLRGFGEPKRALKSYHWLFLAQPAPFPETLIGAAPQFYADHTLASWSKRKDLSAFHPSALPHYRALFTDSARLHATCEDYRAGPTVDREQDEADLAAGRRIAVPMLVMWGDAGIPASGTDPIEAWRQLAGEIEGVQVDSGHFMPEENPDACAEALLRFFA